ncbi:MAG UNVERIFIED_CONTAM: fructose-6-phosphate aldolase [Rickettsiaceae bacterium]|jgi:transaldolase
MEIFIDSADPKEVEEAFMLGIIDGVTTNPTLIAKYGKDLKSTISSICNIVEGPVSVEVASVEYDGMLEEGKRILDIAENIVLKLPITWSGLKACSYFFELGREVNMTLCFSVNQALLAAKAGATYVSPFIGRLDDIGYDGNSLIADIKHVYSNYPEYDVNLLASSIRHPQHFHMSAIAGADAATMPWNVIKQLLDHPLTDKGLARFVEDWKKSGLTV